jgi:DNA-binding HxlR family transcriptional regulator
MIARTASLAIIVKDFGPVESAVKRIMDRYKGYIGQLSTTAQPDAARTLNATLRIPSPQLEAALAELKQLGRVEQESQSGEEVTKEYTDLAARLKNSRATEQRLLDVLRKNTGKVKDVLEVENEISRVRGEIEQMDADQRTLKTRVDFATMQLSLTEDYKASLHMTPPSTMTRLHNAVVEGYRDVVERGIGLAVWLLEAGPTLLLWAAFLFFPARWLWKRWLRARLLNSSTAGPA